jgi:hypothetical protein
MQDTDRSASIRIGSEDYQLILTTRATKEIAKRYGGLENLGVKLMKTENFEMALDEVVIAGIVLMAYIPAVCDGKVRIQQRLHQLIFKSHIIALGKQRQPRLLHFMARAVVGKDFKGIRKRRDHEVFIRRHAAEYSGFNGDAQNIQ